MQSLAMMLRRVLDGAMRRVVIQIVMGIMLFASVESAVDAGPITHHDTDTTHEVHHAPGPDPQHEDGDCAHFCHCAAHLPSIAAVAYHAQVPPLSSRPPEFVAQRYASRLVAPPLRPPTSC